MTLRWMRIATRGQHWRAARDETALLTPGRAQLSHRPFDARPRRLSPPCWPRRPDPGPVLTASPGGPCGLAALLSASVGARAHGHLPPHRRPVGQRAADRRAGRAGRAPVGHVRGRRRLPDHAAADLLRHPADGRGRLGDDPDHRLQRVGRLCPFAARRGRPQDGRGDDRRRRGRQPGRRRPVPPAPGVRPDRPRHRLPLRPAARLDRRADAQGRADRARLGRRGRAPGHGRATTAGSRRCRCAGASTPRASTSRRSPRSRSASSPAS